MWQPVLMICGYFISVLGVAMLAPAALDLYHHDENWSIFVSSSVVAMFIGFSLFLSNRGKIKDISIRQAYLLTVLSWTSVGLLATIPFVFSGMSLTDALFEGFSGITTTGASVSPSIEKLSPSILLWRAVLNGLGGVGIVIFATALLPFLGIGGMQLFQRENSDVNEKFMPKISYMAKRIILVYIILIGLCLFSLKLAGMTWFDALCHSLSTISTSGSSTHNASIGAYDSSSIEWIIALFMFLGACPLAFFYNLVATHQFGQLRSGQVGAFIKILILYVAIMWGWLSYNNIYTPLDALRQAVFTVVSLTSSTGYASSNYLNWGAFAATAALIFTLTGGCSGSTSGSVKIFRWQVVIAQLKRALITTTEPNRMLPLKVGKISVSSTAANSVVIFFMAYFFSIAVLTTLVSICGVDFLTAFSAVINCITNVGCTLAKDMSYADFSDTVKVILSFTMLLGRLEVMTVLVLLCKNFWQR
ncbi:MAG: TrkH family potassium uptake protein [Alphaproteobacteria bacterium]|nr:TrkH family potassium uptake protein [Alphaproteobacteria bacterium]